MNYLNFAHRISKCNICPIFGMKIFLERNLKCWGNTNLHNFITKGIYDMNVIKVPYSQENCKLHYTED
jgi:hypothetical protein